MPAAVGEAAARPGGWGRLLIAPRALEQATARACVVSGSFFFRFYAAALAPRPCPPRFQADAGAARVVGRGRAVRKGTAAGASCGR